MWTINLLSDKTCQPLVMLMKGSLSTVHKLIFGQTNFSSVKFLSRQFLTCHNVGNIKNKFDGYGLLWYNTCNYASPRPELLSKKICDSQSHGNNHCAGS